MSKLVPAMAAALFLMAGCSSGSGGDPAAPTTTPTSTAPPPPPPPTTDTLHLIALPGMSTAAPKGSTDISTPVPASNFGGGGGGGMGPPDAEWMYNVAKGQNVTGGEVHIWIEITETLVQTSNPARPDCAWIASLNVGSSYEAPIACLMEPPGPINPGIKELVFSFTAEGPVPLESNETISMQFERNPFSLSQNTPVNVLSGTKEHDSYVKLVGMKEVIVGA